MTVNSTDETPDPQNASEAVSAGQEDSTLNDDAETPPRLTDSGETDTTDTGEAFTKEYVQGLRDEAAKARVKAKRADDLARELFLLRVSAYGRLADPTDLPYTDELFDADAPALEHAIDELISRKPHLASRKPRGDVDQGARDPAPETVDLAGILRSRAG